MAFNINLFQGAMRLGGARPSLFQVNITNPANGAGDLVTPFMVKTAQIPASTITNIPVNYFGRPVNFAGNRTFEEWTVTVINDEDFAIRNAMEQWQNTINSVQGNLRTFGASSPVLYKSNAQVTQFSKTGVPIRVYSFVGIYPTTLSAIDVSWDTADSLEEFTVGFTYDYWEVSGGITGNAGGI